MSTKYNFDEKRIKDLPFVDIAYDVLKQFKTNFNFQQLAEEVAKVKGLSNSEMTVYLAHLFNEINIDGRFIHLGQNEWGLKNWYPDEQIDALPFSRDDEDYEDSDEEYEDFDDEDNEESIEDGEDFDEYEDEDEEDEEDEEEIEDEEDEESEEEDLYDDLDLDEDSDDYEDLADDLADDLEEDEGLEIDEEDEI